MFTLKTSLQPELMNVTYSQPFKKEMCAIRNSNVRSLPLCNEVITQIHTLPEEDQGSNGPRKLSGDWPNMYILLIPSIMHTTRQAFTYLRQETLYLQVLSQKLSELLVFPLDISLSAQFLCSFHSVSPSCLPLLVLVLCQSDLMLSWSHVPSLPISTTVMGPGTRKDKV
jgi:hypothetical protein